MFKTIIARKYWIMLVFCLTALSVAVYEWKTPYEYKSSVKVFIEDEEFYSSDLNLVRSSPQSRIYYYTKSTEMFDYLIRRFDLYKYYNIDSSAFMHYEIMTAILNNRIESKWDGRYILTVTVEDQDKFMAATLANEIYSKLNEMNKNYVISIAKKKLDIYDQIITNNKQEVLVHTGEFKKLIDECKGLIEENKLSRIQNSFIFDIQSRLGTLSTQIGSINDELLKSAKIYELSAAAMRKDNITSLRLINLALPDTHIPFNVRILNVALLSFVAVIIAILFIMIYFEYNVYFRLTFKS
jgi:hypothetical protein